MDSTVGTGAQTTTGAVAPRDRFLGCLLGGAVGDALGAAVEFKSRAAILETFGPDGITDYAPIYGGLGRITDDTQMTLFTAEGLLRAWVRERTQGIPTTYAGATAHAYQRWLATQGIPPRDGVDLVREPGWLFQQPELHAQRAPGNTCLSALRAPSPEGLFAQNGSKGCGGVMRVAPVGLFHWSIREHHSAQDTFRLGCELAALTHGHPTGQLTAGVLSLLIRELANGASVPEALAEAKPLLCEEADHHETLRAIEMAEDLAAGNLSPETAIARLGEGWVAEEALAIALYCALVARDFRHGVTLAVNHDGDSDSTGSITGNLLGTLYGVDAIPQQWLKPLELREVVAEIAEDLHDFRDWALSPFGSDPEQQERLWRKYSGF
jgi:ADP-ribosylglycohydrolase